MSLEVTPDKPTVASDTSTIELERVSIAARYAGGLRPLTTGVDLRIDQGEVVGLVGESGSGKSITALTCMGLLPNGLELVSGCILLAGRDMTEASEREWNHVRGTEVAMIFQDPMTSLDPCFSVGNQIVEAVRAHRDVSKQIARNMAIEVMGEAGIPEPAIRFEAFPHELSGGLRQRAMIAGALVLEPSVLIADEPTTALDVTTQAQIVELVLGLCEARSMSVLWISHDLAVVSGLADRVSVMHAGELVESGPTPEVFAQPSHHYTAGLLASATHRPFGEPFGFIQGSVPEPSDWGDGCRFGPRCPTFDDVCTAHPEYAKNGPGRMTRCHHPLPPSGA